MHNLNPLFTVTTHETPEGTPPFPSVTVNLPGMGKLDALNFSIDTLMEQRSQCAEEALDEIMALAHLYDNDITGIRVTRTFMDEEGTTYAGADADPSDAEIMEVIFLRRDGTKMVWENYCPSNATPDMGPSGFEIPGGLYGLYSALTRIGYAFYAVHDFDCECVLETSTPCSTDATEHHPHRAAIVLQRKPGLDN